MQVEHSSFRTEAWAAEIPHTRSIGQSLPTAARQSKLTCRLQFSVTLNDIFLEIVPKGSEVTIIHRLSPRRVNLDLFGIFASESSKHTSLDFAGNRNADCDCSEAVLVLTLLFLPENDRPSKFSPESSRILWCGASPVEFGLASATIDGPEEP